MFPFVLCSVSMRLHFKRSFCLSRIPNCSNSPLLALHTAFSNMTFQMFAGAEGNSIALHLIFTGLGRTIVSSLWNGFYMIFCTTVFPHLNLKKISSYLWLEMKLAYEIPLWILDSFFTLASVIATYPNRIPVASTTTNG